MKIDKEKTKESKTKVSKDFSFAQIPFEMIRDVAAKIISPGSVMLYAVIYGYCPNWRNSNPTATVSQEKLSADTGFSVRTISKWTRELHDSGWATVKQIGLNQPNSITLHGKKDKR
ncbi:MAG: helix-turn-helix domain-containing protein [Candidatus Aminicenantaceae bacterium]